MLTIVDLQKQLEDEKEKVQVLEEAAAALSAAAVDAAAATKEVATPPLSETSAELLGDWPPSRVSNYLASVQEGDDAQDIVSRLEHEDSGRRTDWALGTICAAGRDKRDDIIDTVESVKEHCEDCDKCSLQAWEYLSDRCYFLWGYPLFGPEKPEQSFEDTVQGEWHAILTAWLEQVGCEQVAKIAASDDWVALKKHFEGCEDGPCFDSKWLINRHDFLFQE